MSFVVAAAANLQFTNAQDGLCSMSHRPVVVAVVDGNVIWRDESNARCVQCFGETVVKQLIAMDVFLQVTPADVHCEIEQTARSFELSTPEFLTMLSEECGISAKQFAEEIVRPRLASGRMLKAEIRNEIELPRDGVEPILQKNPYFLPSFRREHSQKGLFVLPSFAKTK